MSGCEVHSTALRFAQDGFVDPFDCAQDAYGDWVCLALFFVTTPIFSAENGGIGFVWRGEVRLKDAF